VALAVSTGAAFLPHNFSLIELNIPIARPPVQIQGRPLAGRLPLKERDRVERFEAISGCSAMPAGK
jgi:hypothetical protein